MNKWILLIFICMLSSCGKSNTDYEKNTEDALGTLLSPGISKDQIIDYLETNEHVYTETSLEKCIELKETWKQAPCKNGPYIHSRIKIKKFMNPVQSGAHVYFFFNKEGVLESHDIQIKHTFL